MLEICKMNEIIAQAWKSGMDFHAFIGQIKALHAQQKVTGLVQTPELLAYSMLNEKRMDRILKHGTIETTTTDAKVKKLMLITEGWCGDSAQISPYLYLWSTKLGKEVRVVLRDEHPACMDLFLTNGTHSIPIVVFLNEEDEVLAQWGPRPKALIQLIKGWKEQGMTKEEFNPLIHKWYADDKGLSCVQEWEYIIQ